MSEQFPIRLHAKDEHIALLENLEAWINFEALRSQWFGDESRIIECQVSIFDETEFAEQFKTFQDPDNIALDAHGIALRIDKSQFKVEGILRLEQDLEISDKKQLKQLIKKAFVLIGASLKLPSIFIAADTDTEADK